MITRREFLAAIFAFFALAKDAFASGKRSKTKVQATQQSQRRAKSMIARSDRTGGHFKKKHLNKSPGYLRKRAQRAQKQLKAAQRKKLAKARSPQAKKALQKANKKVRKKSLERSSFANERQARNILARALDQNRQQIAKWRAGKSKRNLPIRTRVGGDAGIIYNGATGRMAKPKQATFVLRKVGKGFELHTGTLSSRARK